MFDLHTQGTTLEIHKAYVHGGRDREPMTAMTVAYTTLDTATRDLVHQEAMLLATLRHSNIIAIVGLATTRRGAPLLIVEHCEGGVLLDHVRHSDPDVIRPSTLLTYCRDVVRGLHFLWSLRIVHGDIAARNVLIDHEQCCKIFSFNTTAKLLKRDSDSARTLQDDISRIPWCAPEVLSNGTYSSASDVWAFGILAWEVMSRGAAPYSDVPASSVASQVQEHYRMPAPEGCSTAVHTLIMKPCWHADPRLRPSFSFLWRILEDLGAVETSDEHFTDSEDSMTISGEPEDETEQKWKEDFANRPMLGASVHHIKAIFSPMVVATVREPWTDSTGQTVNPPESATVRNAFDAVILPAGINRQCPRDGADGCAYVDTLSDQDEVGAATALLSYCWTYSVLRVGDALANWCIRSERNPRRTYIWMDSLCLNHHRSPDTDNPAEVLAAEVGERILAVGLVLPMLTTWRNPEIMSRAWCLLELYTALSERGAVAIEVILPKEEYDAFRTEISTSGLKCVDEALTSIDPQSAAATHQADLQTIQNLMQMLGGYDAIKQGVRQQMSNSLVTLGASGWKSQQPNGHSTVLSDTNLSDDSRPPSSYDVVAVSIADPRRQDLVLAALSEEDLDVVVADAKNLEHAVEEQHPSMYIFDETALQNVGGAEKLRNSTRPDTQAPTVMVVADRKVPDAPYFTDGTMAEPQTSEYTQAHLRALKANRICQWENAPLAPNEGKRLQALRDLGILDTPVEPQFDRITRIAKNAFDVPIAIVSLVDENRQWFKSCIGLDTRETPRDQAFCAHTILNEKCMVVPDATKDARLADNPLVTGGPLIRFYAGAPLILPNNLRLGSLCIIDTRPRTMTQAQIEVLNDLAALTVEEILKADRSAQVDYHGPRTVQVSDAVTTTASV